MDIHKITAGLLKNLNSEEILFLKFSEELGFPENFLKSYIYRKSDEKKFRIDGLIWRYETINFENIGNILNNELYVHLKLIIEDEYKPEEEFIEIDDNISGTISGNIMAQPFFNPTSSPSGSPLTTAYLSSLLSSIPGTSFIPNTVSYSTGVISDSYSEKYATKDDVVNLSKKNIENEKINSNDEYNLYVSLNEFVNEYYSKEYQISKSIANKRFQISAIDA